MLAFAALFGLLICHLLGAHVVLQATVDHLDAVARLAAGACLKPAADDQLLLLPLLLEPEALAQPKF